MTEVKTGPDYLRLRHRAYEIVVIFRELDKRSLGMLTRERRIVCRILLQWTVCCSGLSAATDYVLQRTGCYSGLGAAAVWM